jgi:class 3 adenylate cyclase/tetratricopeptide (TPR) repeat protein
VSVCPSCATETKEGAKFCVECGTPLALRCPSCGTPHRVGQKFCEECGTRLTGGALGPVPAPVPELRLVSVLFVDLVGFTSLSEGREAEDVRELLGRYFLAARTIVERYGGVVEKFIGDAVMAVWGSRTAQEDDAERAVRAALEIVDDVSAFGEEVGAPDLRARAGVVTGQVAAVENPDEGIVVGDRVNTASRVQSAAVPGTVLVDDTTRQVTASAIAFEDAGEHAVKGKVEPLQLWRAVRVVAGVGGRDREQLLEAPFVGRETELRLVKDLLHATVERRAARLVAIAGEPGVGKSRLRREFSNYTDGLADTYLWHMGRCLSHGEGVAYWALAEMVRQRLGIAEDAPVEEATRKLEAGLEEWVADANERQFIAPRLGALLGVAQPGLDRAELFAGWRLFFERLAAHEPVILVFEDMQWADQGLLEFVEQLLDWSTQVPIFMVVLARTELAARREGWPAGRRGATTVHLEPLDEGAMRVLLSEVVDGLPAEAVDRIVDRAQGIPLYAIETIRALVDRERLQAKGGRLVASGDLGELEVPASLNALLASRLDALDAAERELVRAVAVFGGSFTREAAAALADLDEAGIDAALVGLVRKQVLVIRAEPLSPDRGQYAFAQGMLRTVAYEMLPRRERKQRHLAAAEHLTETFPNQGEEVAEVIATHYLDAYRAAGEDPDAAELRVRTLDALRRSARRAASVGAPEVAQRAYEEASEIAEEPDRPLLHQAAGEMAVVAGRVEESIRLLETAAEGFGRAGQERERALTAYHIAVALHRLGRPADAAERVTAALALLGPQDVMDPDVGRLNAMLGRMLVFAGENERAAPVLESALAVAQGLELADVLGEALVNKAHLYGISGRPEEARFLLAGAVEVAARHDLADVLYRAEGNLANFVMNWDLPDALRQTEVALSGARRRGNRYHESLSLGNLMYVHLYAGRWDELERIGREFLGDDDARFGAEFCYLRLLALAALRGETQAADAALARITDWQDAEDPELRADYDACLVAARVAQGRFAEALEHGLGMLAPAIETLGLAIEPVRDGWPDTLRAALASERHDDARRLIGLLAERPPGHIPPYLRAQLARGRALLNAAEGNHDMVEADLRSAIDALDSLAYPYWHAVAQTDLAGWLIDQERVEEAAAGLEQAVATLTRLRAAPALARAEGLRPRLVEVVDP